MLTIAGNPIFGRLSDRTASPWGMRRPWMVIGLLGGTLGILVVALAPTIPVVLVGWCIAQLFFNAILAVLVAVLPDQVPEAQRGMVAGVLGVCTPVASVVATFLVKLFTGNLVAMFLVPCAVGGFFILLFARSCRIAGWSRRTSRRGRCGSSRVRSTSTPGRARISRGPSPADSCSSWLTPSSPRIRPIYLLNKLGSAEADVPQQIFLGTLAQSVLVVLASLIGGRLSDRTGRRKVFVLVASIVYGFALFVLAAATAVNGFFVGMAISGLGFGVYTAVDLALVTQVLPDEEHAAKDLGVFNIAGALPFAIAPAIAPAILAAGGGSYSVLYTVAGLCAVIGAFAVLPVRRVR